MNITIERLKNAMKNTGYKLFGGGNYNLNLIGVRSNDTHANTFNDVFCVLFEVAGVEQLLQFACTTDPGVYYRLHPLNVNGTAVLIPGQHNAMWQLGRHQGKYTALVQRGKATVYRDGNKNEDLDITDVVKDTGYFGINAHRASEKGLAKQVGKFSAGCQVIQHPIEFEILINLCKLAMEQYGNSFTYTLLTEQQLEAVA
jgi:hypothetical protein